MGAALTVVVAVVDDLPTVAADISSVVDCQPLLEESRLLGVADYERSVAAVVANSLDSEQNIRIRIYITMKKVNTKKLHDLSCCATMSVGALW